MSLYREDEEVKALYPLSGDDDRDRTTWHWVNAVVLDVTEGDYRTPTEYQVLIMDARTAKATSYGPSYPVVYRDASELQPRD